ncbi:daptide biosynthesis RiPP recognition protein [Streptomyces sp. NPDC057474]|uniref:daptide biosynthesis RiPP recognition protein n=1 Tax=Streptomyces sp. NPDC057474 TaxID=3346144 RepID=UPI0036980444
MENAPIPLVKKHLSSWGTGRVQPLGPQDDEGVLTVVLEDARHLDALLASDLVGDRTLVFSPGGSTGPVVGYEGSLAEPGGDLSINDAFFLQTQDYGSAGYMSVIGATLVRIVEQADFEAYLDDADRARAEGTFQSFVISPAVQLADIAALGGSSPADGPRTRLYAHADGSLSVSPWGARLGTLGDGLARLDAEWHRLGRDGAHPCALALGRAVPETLGAAAAAERPWLGRYLAAVDALRELQARGIAEARVSGFGGRLAPALDGMGDADAHDAVGTDVPLLLWTQDEAYVHIVDGKRTFKVDHTAGAVIEALLVCGSVEAADAYADRAALLRVERFFRHTGVALGGDALVGAGR